MDATRCGKCGYVYWTRCYENWGTCDRCGTNNDFSKEGAKLVSSDNIFTIMSEEDLEKDEINLLVRRKLK